jgi:hypothetical protein
MSDGDKGQTHSREVVGSSFGSGDTHASEHQEAARPAPAELPNEVDVEARKRDPNAGTRQGQQPYGPKSHDSTSTNQTG